jgi:AraC-like DNA-binding protein
MSRDRRPETAEPPKIGSTDGELTKALVKLLVDDESAIGRAELPARLADATMLLRSELARVDQSRNGGKKSGLPPRHQRRVARYIDRNLANEILLEHLVALTDYSPTYFAVAFKRSFGIPPHAYIARARIARAMEMMLTTGSPLGVIARECGMRDLSHFSRLFRKLNGVSPSAWRRERQSGMTDVAAQPADEV